MKILLCIFLYFPLHPSHPTFNWAKLSFIRKVLKLKEFLVTQQLWKNHLQKTVSKAKDNWLNGKSFPLPPPSHCHLSQCVSFSFLFSLLNTCRDCSHIWKLTHIYTYSQNTPLYLQKAWGRQSAWINLIFVFLLTQLLTRPSS